MVTAKTSGRLRREQKVELRARTETRDHRAFANFAWERFLG